MTEKKAPGLEASMQALEALVSKMESGELSLEESLAAFEKGIALSRQCQRALESAEQKVRILMEKNASAPLADFKEPSSKASASASSDSLDDDTLF